MYGMYGMYGMHGTHGMHSSCGEVNRNSGAAREIPARTGQVSVGAPREDVAGGGRRRSARRNLLTSLRGRGYSARAPGLAPVVGLNLFIVFQNDILEGTTSL